MEMNNPTSQEALVEPFLNAFSSPSPSKDALRPRTIGNKNMIQRIQLVGEDGQNSTCCLLWAPVCLSLLVPVPPPQLYVPITAF